MNEEQENKMHRLNNIIFQKLEEYDVEETDTRFVKAKVWIMHDKSNYNASYFSQESISNAIQSLANTPILCFYTTNKEGDEDFGGHEYRVEQTDNGLELVCKEYAIGVISETDQKTAKFEERLCDDGIVRLFLTCNCTLWTKFNQAMNIFEKQNVKGQSMEITDVEGQFEDDNLYHINKFKFNGCTVLSNNCMPAMANASIEVNFSQQTIKSVSEEIENKLNEFAKYFSKKEEEKENMAKKDTTKLAEEKEDFKKATQVESNDETKVENNSKPSKEEPKAKEFDVNNQDDDSEVVKAIEDVAEQLDNIEDAIDGGSDEDEEDEEFAKKSKADKKVDDAEDLKDGGADEDKEKMSCEDGEDFDCGDGKKKYTLTFSLSFEDIKSQIYDKLYDMENIENTCYAVISTNDNYFKYLDYCTGQFYKQSYVKSDDSITFTGEREEIFNVFVDKATKDAIANVTYSKLQQSLNEANEKIQEYSKANEELLKFQLEVKENERKAEIDEVISRFSKIDALDLEKYKQQAYNKEINNEQLEEKLFAHMGRMNFSMNNVVDSKEVVQAPVNYSVPLVKEDKKDDFVYGEDIKKYFK